jgi:dCMP deaminase
MNAICNAARVGAKTLGMAIAITCEPCLLCAKLIHHAGIELVIYVAKGYSGEGLEYLRGVGVSLTSAGNPRSL